MNKSLIDLLVCPVCRGPVRPEDEDSCLVCPACRVAYPVREGIPVMLPDAAKPWEPKKRKA